MKNREVKRKAKYENEFHRLFAAKVGGGTGWGPFGKNFKLSCTQKLVEDPRKYRFGLDGNFVDYESTEAFGEIEADEYQKAKNAYVSFRMDSGEEEAVAVVEPMLKGWIQTMDALDSGMLEQTEFFKTVSQRTDELLEIRALCHKTG